MADEAKEKKLIIDEDWKAQAQKEKQQLKEEVEKASSRRAFRFAGGRLPGWSNAGWAFMRWG